jgi:hypothetical protein
MITRTFRGFAALALVWGLGALPTQAEDPKAPGMDDPKAFEKLMDELAKPGAMHAWLAEFVGEWDVKGAFMGPDGSQMESVGTASIRMALGGRFQEQAYRGKLKGEPYEGFGLIGYDNLGKQFENHWFDTLGTVPSIARGPLSADKSRLELKGEWVMPGGMKMAFAFHQTRVVKDAFTFEVLMDMGTGTMAPVGKLSYTRSSRKAAPEGAAAQGPAQGGGGETAPGGMPDMNDPAAMKEMEQMMEQLARPGEPHRWLARAQGGWAVSGHFLEPNGVKAPICGTACFRMIQGGRWQEQVISTTMKGKRYEGRGLTGYDNAKQRFENVWLDTMSTGHSVAYGQRSADGNTLTLSGEWEMPGGMKLPFKYVSTYVNANHMTFRMYMTMEGKEALMGEIHYTRR